MRKCIHIYNAYVLMNLTFYHYGIFFVSGNFVLMYILSDNSIAPPSSPPAFLWSSFACYSFSHSFSFNLFVSLNLKYVFYRQQFDIVWLLIQAFIPLTFNVMLIGLNSTVLVFVFCLNFLFLFFVSSCPAFWII